MKKERRSLEEQKKLVAEFRGIDDVFFELLIEDPKVCEEFLQTVLDNSCLHIKPETLVPQKDVKFLVNRSIRVDAYVEGEEDVVFNIEVQRSDECDHVKRVRYNASSITVSKSEPGDDFGDIQELYIIYLTENDFLRGNRTIYHAAMTVKETGETLSDGLHEIYVNTAYNDGSKVSRLMAHFKEEEVDDPEFPEYSRKMYSLKNDPKEVRKVCKLMEDYGTKRERRFAFGLIEKGKLTLEDAIKELNMTEAEILDEMEKEGFKTPVMA